MKKPARTVGYSPWGWKDADLGPFSSLFTHKKSIRDDFKDIDCLLLWGGEDIHPSFYREGPHPRNETQEIAPSDRDIHEWKAMLYCKAHNIPMIGVCRGAQFICVFAGGSLVQDCDRHDTSHPMRTLDGRMFQTTSIHHQMMNPYDVPHHLLAWAFPARSNYYENGNRDEILTMVENHEPEVVFFPQVRGLAIQGHPEYSWATHAFQEYCVEMARKYLFEEQS